MDSAEVTPDRNQTFSRVALPLVGQMNIVTNLIMVGLSGGAAFNSPALAAGAVSNNTCNTMLMWPAIKGFMVDRGWIFKHKLTDDQTNRLNRNAFRFAALGSLCQGLSGAPIEGIGNAHGNPWMMGVGAAGLIGYGFSSLKEGTRIPIIGVTIDKPRRWGMPIVLLACGSLIGQTLHAWDLFQQGEASLLSVAGWATCAALAFAANGIKMVSDELNDAKRPVLTEPKGDTAKTPKV